jgi:hypothetical protein
MTEKTTTETTPPPPTPSRPPAPVKLTHDEFMAKLAANPQFKLVRGSGQGFVIGGQSPAQGKR